MATMDDGVKTVEWTAEGVSLIDQRQLPRKEEYVLCRSAEEVAEAIRTMVVRGAPAIGVTAAMGIALGIQKAPARTPQDLKAELSRICDTLAATRPTAVNLFWAIGRMRNRFDELVAGGADLETIRERMQHEAQSILEEDVAACHAIGDYGAGLLPAGKTVMTICNAGALETRPFLQGARLTAWELQRDGIPTTLITDNMAGYFLHSGRVGAVVVGADRIAANGDTANKIGTYSVAVLAKENSVPF